jgi:hypothetical protein
MKFIARREDCAGNPGDDKQDRHLHLPASTTAERTPKQRRQDCVLSDVSELTHHHLNRRDGRSGHLRVQPPQERDEKTRCLLRRQHVRRADENQTEPDQNRQPIFEKRFHPEVGSQRFDDSVFCVSQSAIYNLPSTMTAPLTYQPIFMERMYRFFIRTSTA